MGLKKFTLHLNGLHNVSILATKTRTLSSVPFIFTFTHSLTVHVTKSTSIG